MPFSMNDLPKTVRDKHKRQTVEAMFQGDDWITVHIKASLTGRTCIVYHWKWYSRRGWKLKDTEFRTKKD